MRASPPFLTEVSAIYEKTEYAINFVNFIITWFVPIHHGRQVFIDDSIYSIFALNCIYTQDLDIVTLAASEYYSNV